jgi:hypothetical protein
MGGAVGGEAAQRWEVGRGRATAAYCRPTVFGRWDVKFLRRAGAEFTVVAAEYNISHTVGRARLRPCWVHTPGAVPSREWSSVVAGRTFYYDAASGAAVAEAAMEAAEAAGAAGAAGHGASEAAVESEAAEAAGAAAVAGAGAEEAEEEEAEEETDEALLAGFKWGLAVECSSAEEGLQGCWCPAEVLQVQPEQRAVMVAWLDESADPPQELVPLHHVRPAPPPPPAGWVSGLRQGEPCEVYFDSAWWEVTLESRHGERLKVPAPHRACPRATTVPATACYRLLPPATLPAIAP